jgi:hypothetical protein
LQATAEEISDPLAFGPELDSLLLVRNKAPFNKDQHSAETFPLKLVMFSYAVQHILRLTRLLNMPQV